MALQLFFAGLGREKLWRRRLGTIPTLSGFATVIGVVRGLAGFCRWFKRQWLRIVPSGGTDNAGVQQILPIAPVDGLNGVKLRALAALSQTTPLIGNLTEPTPEVKAQACGVELRALRPVASLRSTGAVVEAHG